MREEEHMLFAQEVPGSVPGILIKVSQLERDVTDCSLLRPWRAAAGLSMQG